MSQQNIDFGTFPDDPSADAIRTAFQKVQENFNEIYGSTLDAAVLSVNQTAGRGITVNTPTGNVVVTANISSITVSSLSMKVGVTPNPSTNTAVYTNFNQTLYVELPSNVSITNLNVSGNITAGGNLTASNAQFGNNAIASFFIGDGSLLTNVDADTANVSNTAGTVTQNAQPNINSVGILTSLSVSGNIIAGNTYANAGIIQAQYLKGDGSNITGVSASGSNVIGQVANALVAGTVYTNAQPNITSTGTLVSLSVSGNANIGNIGTGIITATGNITGGNLIGTLLTGTLTTNSQPNVTSVGTLTSLSVSGNSNIGNIGTSGNLSVTGNSNIGNIGTNIITSTGNVTGANIITGGLITAIGNITGGNLVTSNLVSAGTLTVSGVSNLGSVSNVTITGGSSGEFLRTNGSGVLTWSDVPANSSIINGTSNINIATSGGNVTTSVGGTSNVLIVTSTGANITGTLSVSGNSNVGNIGAASGVFTTIEGSLTTAAQPNITSVGILTTLSVSGNSNVGNIGATNIVGTLTTSSQPNITSVGVLTGLTLGGNLNSNSNIILNTTSANISILGNISAQGNVTGGNLITSGVVSATGNITSVTGVFVGNGAGLTNINAGNIIDNYGNSNVATFLASFGSNTITTTGNANVGNIGGTNGVFTNVSGNGSALTAITGANVTGAVSFATTANSVAGANVSGQVANALIAGTVYTNAQPNITSTGTLTSLSVSGQITNANITTGANTTAGSLTGNWTLTTGSRLQATYADLAEYYAGSEQIESGTVVEFGGEQEVQICNIYMSKLVAGIVTTDPAYVMNSGIKCEYPIAIALQGRIPAKVIGPVKRGDMMVSANNGHAISCKSPSMGTVLGKALTDFNGDVGIIEIMVGRT
jgi:hypothetical protein